ncbi:MAG: preprotein translocase subunit YajC [Flavobacteriaceae bacterium]|jgi:preprotein translocase subunit YajC|nr:preprotein translocase subunit YajC [Flavobacteriaceae bacterium]MDG1063159.1 preprotein translocase subunit YajC [Flavobacteriaceae bacterium]MDG1961498.1 preprotein translocase subunit YajC [Flavobacteriaceae bacterium]
MESIQGFAPLILMFLVVYLFMIRPQMKRAKQEKKFAAEMKKGDKVVTKSGLHAKVLELNDDDTCVLESGAGKMKYERSAISLELSQKLNKGKATK